MLRRLLVPASWAVVAAWPFWGPLFDGRVLFFRDVSVTYYPDLVFLERALALGVWPLWHPGADAGAPFLAPYPVHLALVALFGARATLALSPWLHVFVAMLGAGALARRLALASAGCWTAGCVYGLSGWLLGSVLYPVFLAAAWLPLAVALLLQVLEAPRARDLAVLAVVLALQVSTLGIEVLPQTALATAALARRLPTRKAVGSLIAAALLAGLLAAPALAGAAWLLPGTSRGAGFAPEVGLSYSASLPVLLEAGLPRFLGDPHTFGDLGFWGQPFFPDGAPFFLSLYLGPVVLLLAVRAGRHQWRLWALAGLAVLLAAGVHGPLGPALAHALRYARVPPKFFLLATLALALLAGRGVDRARRGGWSPAALVPGLGLLAAAFVAWRWPGAIAAGLSAIVPDARGPLARYVIAYRWPSELAISGLLTLGAGLALLRGRSRLAVAAGVLAVLDLARVNGALNPGAPAGFYELRPAMQRLVAAARGEPGRSRWFSYGLAHSGRLTWRPEIAAQNSDVWLYYVDRQSLLPRTQVLDGLEGAFDIDRMGLAPDGSTLHAAEARPELFRGLRDRLRAANVRWVLSFNALPADLASPRGEAPFPELAERLRLYELRDPLPRAYYVKRLEDVLAGPSDAGASVEYESPDPHTVRVRCRTPPGFVVVLDGSHPDWHAADGSGPLVIQTVAGRYRAVPTPGGEREITFRFEPRWRAPAMAAVGLGSVLALALFLAPLCVRIHRTFSAAVLDSPPSKRA